MKFFDNPAVTLLYRLMHSILKANSNISTTLPIAAWKHFEFKIVVPASLSNDIFFQSIKKPLKYWLASRSKRKDFIANLS